MDVPVIMLEFQQSKSFEKLEVPQIQLIVGVQDIPVVSQETGPHSAPGAVLGGCRHARCCSTTGACSCSLSTRLLTPCRGAEAGPHGSRLF